MIGHGPEGGGPDLLGALAAGTLNPSAGARPAGRAGGGEEPEDLVCSRRGCTAHARFALEWNNPRIHAPERVKTWLACPAHRPFLDDFLSARGLLRRTRPLEPSAPGATEAPSPQTHQEHLRP